MGAAASLLTTETSLTRRLARWRIGLIALATDLTIERDFATLRIGDDVAIYVNRVAFENPMTRENLMAMRPRLAAAAGLILPGESLDALAYSCTSASALIGDMAIREAVWEAKPGTAVITPAASALAAFAHLGCGRISLLAPYSVDVTDAIVEYFEDNGQSVISAGCLGLADDRETARLDSSSIIASAMEACHPRAEGLFISCTALPALKVVQEIEARLGRPVITSNQAMFWHSLRQAGCPLRRNGFGRLLQ